MCAGVCACDIHNCVLPVFCQFCSTTEPVNKDICRYTLGLLLTQGHATTPQRQYPSTQSNLQRARANYP